MGGKKKRKHGKVRIWWLPVGGKRRNIVGKRM